MPDRVLQQDLADAWALNRHGSAAQHVLVMLPSFSLAPTILGHYAPRLAALEHRYLLTSLMLEHMPGCQVVYLCSEKPAPEVLDYYDAISGGNVLRGGRFHVVEVADSSARGLSAKLLDRPDLLAHVRGLVAERPALIEPWNVTADELAVARALGLPLLGTPDQLKLSFKSVGRKLFRQAGVPVPSGVEDVKGVAGVMAAVDMLRSHDPRLPGVVVKHDDSAAGDGNQILRLLDESGRPVGLDDVRRQIEAWPEWYRADLAHGSVVEEFVNGDEVSSPSVSIDIDPHGDVHVLCTHEQVLGGPEGFVYLGCRFPAAAEYAERLAEHGMAIGHALAELGAVGRASIDFMARRVDAGWEVFALEINMRKGGTTHPFTALRHLAPGHYDQRAGDWRCVDGTTRAYVASDNLQHDEWLGLPAARVLAAMAAEGLTFDRTTRTGVVLHMLSCLAVDGRLGCTAIGRDPKEAMSLQEATEATISGCVSALT
jgi:hypothetical protein